jgi:membrane-bound lytic murein transglycosylase B
MNGSRRGSNNIKPAICLLLALATGAFGVLPARAQTTLEQVAAEQSQLQQQLAALEKEISGYQSQLTKIKGQKNTLVNKIAQLQKQQALIAAQIKISSLKISDIDAQEVSLQNSVKLDKTKINDLQTEMAALIIAINMRDRRSFLEIMLTSDNLAQAFIERADDERLIQNLDDIFNVKKLAQNDLTAALQTISEKRDEENNLLSIKSLQEKQLTGSVSEQSTLLTQTKGKESAYQASLKSSQAEVAAIKSRMYQLLEVSAQINFGQAVQIAQWASSETGVRAAFLLAILTQESSLGKNVGTCNRAGDPPSKSWKVVMKPDRDQAPFKQITSELGMNINTTPVSCPMKDKNGNQIGWGGAMGPAQFIPSTWMGYRAKVAAVTGKAANPWDIRDAFLAAAIKLKDGGAGSQSGEWAAAMKYFSGGTNPAYRFYGDNVVATAAQYTSDIAKLNQ